MISLSLKRRTNSTHVFYVSFDVSNNQSCHSFTPSGRQFTPCGELPHIHMPRSSSIRVLSSLRRFRRAGLTVTCFSIPKKSSPGLAGSYQGWGSPARAGASSPVLAEQNRNMAIPGWTDQTALPSPGPAPAPVGPTPGFARAGRKPSGASHVRKIIVVSFRVMIDKMICYPPCPSWGGTAGVGGQFGVRDKGLEMVGGLGQIPSPQPRAKSGCALSWFAPMEKPCAK